MHKHWIAAAGLIVAVGGCQADGRYPYNERESEVPSARDHTTTDVPTGSTGAVEGADSTEGPHEGTRASTPPGTSRDGQPPVGGAIVDPTGAVTREPPPPAMR